MSNNNLIPKEKLSAYQRWEMSQLDAAVDSGITARNRSETRTPPRSGARDEGYEAGYREGIEAGLREGAHTVAAQAAALSQLLGSLRQELDGLDQRLADHVLEFALVVARQMVRQALRIKPHLVTGVVQEALRQLTQGGLPARVIVHPDDARLLNAYIDELGAAAPWSLVEDASITRGGCRVETAASEIDATLKQRWQRIVASLGRSDEWLE